VKGTPLEDGQGVGEVVPVAVIKREDGEALAMFARFEPGHGLVERHAGVTEVADRPDCLFEEAGCDFENAVRRKFGAVILPDPVQHEDDADPGQRFRRDPASSARMEGEQHSAHRR
jgi:hypothetical protein